MIQVEPFNGILYNKDKVKNVSRVIAPPYDIISPLQQDELYRRSPYNIIRLILTKGVAPQKYVEAAKTFRNWLAKNVLIKDQKPLIYVLSQKFTVAGREFTRTGFIALKNLESGGVYPHEKTFSKPKEDRMKLMRTTHANFEQVFVAFSDKDCALRALLKRITKGSPQLKCRDYNGFEVKMWRMDDPKDIAYLKNKMSKKKLLIADGHHRYETAVKFAEENKKLGMAVKYFPLYFSAIEDKGLLILPIYRLVRGIDKSVLNSFAENLKKYFKVKKVKKLKNILEGFIGVFCGHGKYYLIDIRNKSKVPSGRNLDLDVLHDFIIKKLLKVESTDEHIVYTKDLRELIKLVEEKKFQIGFLLSGFPIESALKVAFAGQLLPQKSTFFYPKIPSGLVMRDMEV